MKAVLKIGGSLLFQNESRLDVEYIKSLGKEIQSIPPKKFQLAMVVGGGRAAREYIATARQLGASEAFCDELGIEIARQNARLLIAALGEMAYPVPPSTLEEAATTTMSNKIIVMGGIQPGQSTNAVAALLAERINAELLINATDVEGVYSEDPKINPTAIKYEEISVKHLKGLIKDESRAGKYELFDLNAINIIGRSKIPTIILSGRDPKNIMKALQGAKIGTKITYT
ncbi:MAG: UMP kinase [Candidatus Helarchaeota archaeon]